MGKITSSFKGYQCISCMRTTKHEHNSNIQIGSSFQINPQGYDNEKKSILKMNDQQEEMFNSFVEAINDNKIKLPFIWREYIHNFIKEKESLTEKYLDKLKIQLENKSFPIESLVEYSFSEIYHDKLERTSLTILYNEIGKLIDAPFLGNIDLEEEFIKLCKRLDSSKQSFRFNLIIYSKEIIKEIIYELDPISKNSFFK